MTHFIYQTSRLLAAFNVSTTVLEVGEVVKWSSMLCREVGCAVLQPHTLRGRSCCTPQVAPLPVTGTFFAPTLTPAVSRLVVSAMRSLGLLDSQSYLTFNPRYSSQVRRC